MNNLKKFTNEQLAAELEAREQAILFRPKKLNSPDFGKLMSMIDKIMANAKGKADRDEVFETAIICLYGYQGLDWYHARSGDTGKSPLRRLFKL